jgi:adrenodoxin-NADP+ reductase
VGWYNGHPAFADLPVDLRGVTDVSVVGQGNVAMDVARILLKRAEDLSGTDIPDDILHILAQSDVKHVRAVGRRGPGQVAFTTKEFREIISIPGVGFEGLKGGMMEDAKALVKGDRMRTRILGLMEKDNKHVGGMKSFSLDFLKSPAAFRGDERVSEVDWTVNQLLPSARDYPAPPPSQPGAATATGGASGEGTGLRAGSSGGIVARPTGEKVTTKADMVVESVGYRSEPLGPVEEGGWGLPFDRSKGRVKNVGGRVVAEDGVAVSYAC